MVAPKVAHDADGLLEGGDGFVVREAPFLADGQYGRLGADTKMVDAKLAGGK